jgi:hypothetical protein
MLLYAIQYRADTAFGAEEGKIFLAVVRNQRDGFQGIVPKLFTPLRGIGWMRLPKNWKAVYSRVALISTVLSVQSVVTAEDKTTNEHALGDPRRSLFVAYKQRAYADWAPSKLPLPSTVVVSCFLVEDGKMYRVKIDTSSGDAQSDADCLQAVYGIAGTRSGQVEKGSLIDLKFTFDSETMPGHRTNAVEQYFAAHPEKRHNFVAFYRIPLDVLRRYPGIFSETELLSPSNIGLIRIQNADRPELPRLDSLDIDRFRDIFGGHWMSFFMSHSSATRQEIETFRDSLSNLSD